MAYKAVNNSSLTSVANKIREKGNTAAQLAFPDGFVSAIGDIVNPTTGDYFKVAYGVVSYTNSSNKSFSATVNFTPTGALLILESGFSDSVQSASTSLDSTDNYGISARGSFDKITNSGLVISGNTVSMSNPKAGSNNLTIRTRYFYVIWGK